MRDTRAFLARHPAAIFMALVLALLMKAWVPIGYMPAMADGALAMLPCSGHGPMAMPTANSNMPADSNMSADSNMPGDMAHMASDTAGNMAGPAHDSAPDQTSAQQIDMPCVFSGLTAPVLTGADPQLLAAALAFVFVAVVRTRVRARIARPAFLQPPAQAPPARIA